MSICVSLGVTVAVQEPDERPPRRRSCLAAVVVALAATTLAVPAAADTPTAPGKPTGLEVVSASHDQVNIAWDDPGDASISGYQVLRRLRDTYAAGRFDIINPDTGTADTAYTDTDVTPSTRYVYRVKAINPAGTSRQSGTCAHRPPPPPPNSDDDEGSDGSDGGGVIAPRPSPWSTTQTSSPTANWTTSATSSPSSRDPPPLQFSPQTTDALDYTRYPDLVMHSDNSDPRSICLTG